MLVTSIPSVNPANLFKIVPPVLPKILGSCWWVSLLVRYQCNWVSLLVGLSSPVGFPSVSVMLYVIESAIQSKIVPHIG
jgi:hypothetical protein